jgi:hypothetical protein
MHHSIAKHPAAPIWGSPLGALVKADAGKWWPIIKKLRD